MFKQSARKLTLALTLLALTTPALHAGVTGGDPEPTSPNIVQIVLSVLHLA